MNTELLKKSFEGLDAMPDSELEFVSQDPEKALMDCAIYNECKHKNDFTAWEKLKKMRQMFKK